MKIDECHKLISHINNQTTEMLFSVYFIGEQESRFMFFSFKWKRFAKWASFIFGLSSKWAEYTLAVHIMRVNILMMHLNPKIAIGLTSQTLFSIFKAKIIEINCFFYPIGNSILESKHFISECHNDGDIYCIWLKSPRKSRKNSRNSTKSQQYTYLFLSAWRPPYDVKIFWWCVAFWIFKRNT